MHLRGSGPPASGIWAAGDVIVNEAPAPGGYHGWICVAAGAPGAWRPFGLIAP